MSNSSKEGNYFTADKALKFAYSGCKLLDCVLGGGWALGRTVNVVGDKSSGKTLLAIEACANFAKTYPNGRIEYHEAEAAFDKMYAQALGLPLDRVTFTEDLENSVEALFENLQSRIKEQLARSDKNGVVPPYLYILDSLDALSDRAELKRKIDEGTFGANKPKQLSEMFRRLIKQLEKANITLFVISQVRDNIGVTFGAKHTRSGGKALDFYASQVIWLSEKGKISKTIRGIERPIGLNIRAHCKKNKVSLPYRECEFPIIFGYGVDDLMANLNWLDKIKELPEVLRNLKLEELSPKEKEVDAGEKKKEKGASTKKIGFKLRREKKKEAIESISIAVKKIWNEIETEFLPTEKKY